MPEPGSHKFDIHRTRRRGQLEREHVPSVPDQHADRAAREELEQQNPPHKLPPTDRAIGPKGSGTGASEHTEFRGGMTLRSPAFSDHDFLPERCAHESDEIAPTIEWTEAPEGTAELLLMCEDPDAPGEPFLHWLVTGIPSDVSSIVEGRLPAPAHEGRNGFGEAGWGGPLPPAGDRPHHYMFELFALDAPVELPDEPSVDDIHCAVEEHLVASGTTVGLFAR